MPKNEDEWKQKLTPTQFKILREGGTEAAFTGKLLHEDRDGTFVCAACGNPLFSSATKFDSGSGWPSFDEALPGAVTFVQDNSHGMMRTEVRCARCHSHLGHLFDDGPTSTGKRFCMNSESLEFGEGEKK